MIMTMIMVMIIRDEKGKIYTAADLFRLPVGADDVLDEGDDDDDDCDDDDVGDDDIDGDDDDESEQAAGGVSSPSDREAIKCV